MEQVLKQMSLQAARHIRLSINIKVILLLTILIFGDTRSGVDEILIEEFFDYLNAEIAIVEWGNSLRKAVDNYYELQISGGEKRIIEMTAK